MKKIIYDYCTSKLPEEACGVIIIDEGTKKFIPIDNVAEDKVRTFELDPKSWITLLLSGVKIEAIVHSHPEETGLSDIDIKAAQFLAIPYMVVQLPSGKETWTNK
jgi:proteasome lid subunit RPN8/RPN11